MTYPVHIFNTKELTAPNLIIICLGVVTIGNSKGRSFAADWPSSLGDHDLLATGGSLRDGKRSVEEGLGVRDSIVLCGLKVWKLGESAPIDES